MWDECEAGGWDVVIVGAGAAGLYTALSLPRSLRVLVITKKEVALSASDWAQGGIAAVVAADDSLGLHVEDTLKAGAGLCDRRAVEFLVERAADCVRSLVDLGVAFDRWGDGLALTREAAHSRPRVLHAADRTGRAVVTTLTETVMQCPNITLWSETLVVDVSVTEGCCDGLWVVRHDQVRRLRAGAVILATGGGGQVFAYSTNPAVSTGDGVAIAHRAGVVLRDLEFFQFHPTALMVPGAPCFLISEAVRGEGAYLVDMINAPSELTEDRRFTLRYHPDGELAPRDIVSRAIFSHLQETGQSRVYLDLRTITPEHIQQHFPTIISRCREWGVDPLTQPIPVAPAAHYWMGGVGTDLHGATSLPGLYAVGETASTGVHGANRLASNSLLECLVFGQALAERLGQALVPVSPGLVSALDLGSMAPLFPGKLSPLKLAVSDGEREMLSQWRQQLPEVLWRCAGISRTAKDLESGLDQVRQWRSQWQVLAMTQQLLNRDLTQDWQLTGEGVAHLRLWNDLRNLIEIGELILASAHFRQESRGGHYRADFPETDPAWQVHTRVRYGTYGTAPLD